MKLVTEGDTNGITDYWIELDNADRTTYNDYLDLLDIWVYDNNYGRENHVKIIYNHKQY